MKSTVSRIGLGVAAAAVLLAAGIWIGRMVGASAGKSAPLVPAVKPAPAKPSAAPPASGPAGASKSASQPPAVPSSTAATAVPPLSSSAANSPANSDHPAAGTDAEHINADALNRYFKTLNDSNSEVCEVRPGDNLTRIAKQFGVTPGLIQASNFLKNDHIRPGQKLRIPKARWSLVVNKTQNTLYLKAGEAVIRNYRVATGKDRSTPVGTFKILNHLKNPTWYYEGKVVPSNAPDNPLGTRWMGFDKEGYGIHGTSKPEEIGQFATLGCVRMLNEDIESLFEILPDGTEVTVVE